LVDICVHGSHKSSYGQSVNRQVQVRANKGFCEL